MPSGFHASEPSGSFRAGTPNRMTRGHAELGELAHLLAQALPGVLHDAGQRGDGLRLVDALPHEQRGDEVVRRRAGSRPRGAAGPAMRRSRRGRWCGKVTAADASGGPVTAPVERPASGHLGQRRDHQIGRRDVVSQRQRARAGHREQTGGDGRRHSGGRVLEGHGSGRAERRAGRRRRGTARGAACPDPTRSIVVMATKW